MAILDILSFPDPRLRTEASPVVAFDSVLLSLIEDMKETMYAQSGIGLAATQVNIHRQLLVLDVSENRDQFRVFINPELTSATGSETCEEGCLSVPGVYAEVTRAREIRVRAQNPDGSIFEANLTGLDAVCLQHEMDHLEGKLFVDYLSPLKRMMLNKRLEKQKRRGEQDAVTL